MPVKKVASSRKQELKAKSTVSSLRATAKQSSSDTIKTKIATKPSASRNDKKEATRLDLTVPIYSLVGTVSGTLVLPKEIFGRKVNKALLAQAVRVYSTNQKALTGSTKTRGEVQGSTAKIYRQKGTGRARHGAVRAPIFVGGGIVFGPKFRKVTLTLPQKMKKAALLSALSSKVIDKSVVGLAGIDKSSGKTKEMVKLISSVISHQTSDKRQKQVSALIVTADKQDNVVRAVRNIPGINVLPANLINAYQVLKHELLLITKEAAEKIGNQPVIASEVEISTERRNLDLKKIATPPTATQLLAGQSDKRRIKK